MILVRTLQNICIMKYYKNLIFVSNCLFIYLFIYNTRYEMHWQDPILVNNKMKACLLATYSSFKGEYVQP